MTYINELWATYSPTVFSFAFALLILLGFYILAVILRALIKKAMLKTDLDNRFIRTVGLKKDFPVENVVAGVIFWIVIAFGLLGFFDKLNLQTVAQPINTFLSEISAFVPKLGAAIGLMILAWVFASLIKIVISRGAELLKIDQRLSALEGDGAEVAGDSLAEGEFTIAQSLATAGYWFVFLLFLPLILGALNMQGLVTPLQDMFSEIFTYLPHLFSAALIFIIGSFVARIVRKILSSLLAATGIDNLSERAGLKQKLSALIGSIAFTVILLLVIVQSLDALKIEAISVPAKHMIDLIFLAVPGIISAMLVITVSYFVGKLLSGIVSDLLTAAGFNQAISKLGVNADLPKTPSEYIGGLVLFGMILFAILGATELIGFEPLGVIVSNLINFTFQALLGALILGLGIIVAKKVHELVVASGVSPIAANLARVAILVLTTAMALRQIGLAEDIINLAFGILLGAVGIGLAIAIGLGSKDVIGAEVDGLIKKIKSD